MNEEILINVTPPETRVAVIENGVVQEIIIERTARRGLVGNIYKGKVCRVLPGMQAAFVDVGLERAAFLHASDIYCTSGREQPITELVREGGEIVVQVVKDPLGSKGARLTTNVSIPSRYMVFMPNMRSVGVSQKIEDEDERVRLREILARFAAESELPAGFIARTAAEGIGEEALRQDMLYLQRLWQSIKEKARNVKAVEVLHEDLPLGLRALRDLVGPEVERVRIDSRSTFEKARQFAHKFLPDADTQIEYYPGERPIFDLYGVEDEIQKALRRTVELKSGGHLVIDQTEAMTTIDVNTGAFVGHRTLEETIFKTNLEAAQAICRQLRLRNLGGIIIIDFIDMTDLDHKRQVIRALERCLARDHAKTHISEVSSLGLVEMTRKRTRESLEHVLCETCPTCRGRGSIKTAETTCYEIFREILREARQFDVEQLLVLAAPDVIDRLLDEESQNLAELEQFIGKPIKLQAEALYTQEQYDVVLV
ncbi:ribonuclease G [endosymbiont of unidentified scaly snail isolate Monju]|uniref:ribonuclease G n=1 Tax=endosymbiont of unidentified scaly snail isolate Monju TaxID=1248727 RepID=UPI0003892D8B|nr:ribonuclease G [endosymbiont of unidentified scaly snail isolate Monju]BAN70124.1 ribonuclease G [endosymbiont of unidentified scaly snail isolate Monju]